MASACSFCKWSQKYWEVENIESFVLGKIICNLTWTFSFCSESFSFLLREGKAVGTCTAQDITSFLPCNFSDTSCVLFCSFVTMWNESLSRRKLVILRCWCFFSGGWGADCLQLFCCCCGLDAWIKCHSGFVLIALMQQLKYHNCHWFGVSVSAWKLQ